MADDDLAVESYQAHKHQPIVTQSGNQVCLCVAREGGALNRGNIATIGRLLASNFYRHQM
jgi:hypothetical protein